MMNKVLIDDYEKLSGVLISLQSQVTNTEERLIWEKSTSIFRYRILDELKLWGGGIIPMESLRIISTYHADEKLPDSSISLIFNSLRQLKKIRLSNLDLSNDWVLDW